MSRIDEIAEDYTLRLAALVPSFATEIGVPGFDHLLEQGTPEEQEHRAQIAREALVALRVTDPVDQVDVVTAAALSERLSLEIELVEAREYQGALNNIECPMLHWRDIFESMATESVADWEKIASRLARLPRALAGYTESLRSGIGTEVVPAKRQVLSAIRQAKTLAGPESFFVGLVQGRPDSLPPVLASALVSAAAETLAAYDSLAAFFVNELAPAAPDRDGVGRERYQRFSRYFLGARIDLAETYDWGLAELRRIASEQQALAVQIGGPGTRVAEAAAILDADPGRIIEGTAALESWMSEVSAAAIAELSGQHFDLAPELSSLECRVAAAQNGGIYYVPPSLDFSRPGRMWWSVPPGETRFSTWREKTTVYHEGVPGHHLQCGQAILRSGELNLWRRAASWIAGHGEGWALYAEKLMADLGYLTDPGDRFGLLDAQRLRAARVVVDIGVHLGLAAPEAFGGRWTAEKAWQLLSGNVLMKESSLRFEWLRYLGWPGQAPSYLVGLRLWEGLRDEVLASGMTLKGFHAEALNLGSLPMSVLRSAVLGTAD